MEQASIEKPIEEENHVINQESDQESDSTESEKLVNPFLPSSDNEAPPIPERPNEDTIPKAYTLGYDDLLVDDDLEYGDQSYIENDLLRNPPPVPAPLPPTIRKDLLTEDQSLSLDSNTASPTCPQNDIPSPRFVNEIVNEEPSFKDKSIDELIGLAPEKPEEEKKGMKDLLEKMKGQTSNVFNKIFRRGSQETDLLGIEQVNKEEEEKTVKPTVDIFASFSTPLSNQPKQDSNEDVADLFGLSEDKEEKEPTNIASSSDHKLFFHSNKDPFNDIMTILRVGKLVTANELTWIQQKYNEDKKNVLRILQNFLIKGDDIEFNRFIRRTTVALPETELKLKVIKEKNGERYEIKRLQAISLSVPKIFVYNNSFFFLVEMRASKMNLMNQWTSCIVQLTKYQMRIYKNLADISPDNTILRINFHQLMLQTNVQSKLYKQSLYYYFKLFENDLWNHRVLESKPLKYRHDISTILLVKLGSKEEIVMRALAYQLQLRLKSINNQEKVEF